MKAIAFFLIFSMTIVRVFSQQQYPITYQQLKEYEGLYEYRNQSPFKIAASPKNIQLYAIINDVKFELTHLGKDLL